MIHADVTIGNERILKMEVKGHAGSGTYGHDLVCAEVSAVMTGLCNAVDEAGFGIRMIVEPGYVLIDTEGDDSHDLQVILKTGIAQLKTIEYTNADFIEMKQTEV